MKKIFTHQFGSPPKKENRYDASIFTIDAWLLFNFIPDIFSAVKCAITGKKDNGAWRRIKANAKHLVITLAYGAILLVFFILTLYIVLKLYID